MAIITTMIISDDICTGDALKAMLNKAPAIFKVLDTVAVEKAPGVAQRLQPEAILFSVQGGDRLVAYMNEIKKVCPQTALVLVTEHYDAEIMVESCKMGVDAYLVSMAPGYLTRTLELVCRGGVVVMPRAFKDNVSKQLITGVESMLGQPEELTHREKEIFNLLVKKASNSEIARRLYISESTVKSHVRSILRKIGVKNRFHLVPE